MPQRRLKAKCTPASGKWAVSRTSKRNSYFMPQKGDKANARSYLDLDKWYQIQLQYNWTGLLIDGMFLIYTNPIPNTKIADYVLFLIARYASALPAMIFLLFLTILEGSLIIASALSTNNVTVDLQAIKLTTHSMITLKAPSKRSEGTKVQGVQKSSSKICWIVYF